MCKLNTCNTDFILGFCFFTSETSILEVNDYICARPEYYFFTWSMLSAQSTNSQQAPQLAAQAACCRWRYPRPVQRIKGSQPRCSATACAQVPDGGRGSLCRSVVELLGCRLDAIDGICSARQIPNRNRVGQKPIEIQRKEEIERRRSRLDWSRTGIDKDHRLL
jgi:hypothetical protein